MTKLEEQFEQNFLDGDKLSDSKGAMFTVSGGMDIAKYFYSLGQASQPNLRELDSWKVRELKRIMNMRLDDNNKLKVLASVIHAEKRVDGFVDDVLSLLPEKEL